MRDNDRVIKTYVWHGEQCFFVSTIERDSSAPVLGASVRYNETIVWRYDWAKHERGELMAIFGTPRKDVSNHFKIAEALHKTGALPMEEA